MTPREHFFSILEGKRPEQTLFAPDVTNWYMAHRVPAGAPPDRPSRFRSACPRGERLV